MVDTHMDNWFLIPSQPRWVQHCKTHDGSEQVCVEKPSVTFKQIWKLSSVSWSENITFSSVFCNVKILKCWTYQTRGKILIYSGCPWQYFSYELLCAVHSLFFSFFVCVSHFTGRDTFLLLISPFSPDVILCGWLGSKHQLTN